MLLKRYLIGVSQYMVIRLYHLAAQTAHVHMMIQHFAFRPQTPNLFLQIFITNITILRQITLSRLK